MSVIELENFLKFSNCCEFDFDSIYHNHAIRDHKEYDKIFALVDTNCMMVSDEMKKDLEIRIHTLKKKNTKIILCNLWESKKQILQTIYAEIFKETGFDIWHGGLAFFWYMMYQKYKYKKLQFDHSNKKFDFLYLNKKARAHRKKLFDALTKQNLLENSLVSFIDRNIRLPEQYELPWIINKNYPYRGMDQDLYEKPYNDTVCSIVSETNVGDGIFITEKIWKPIIAGHIFVVHGNNHYLKYLRELGFRTFSNTFDETYDDEINENKKIKKIVETIKTIKSMGPKELYQRTQDTRAHNQQVFFDESKVKSAVNIDILNLIKSFDSSKIPS
jgi:hypothetical protein